MYCPNCLVEYREGFTICSDCQVALLDGLPPAPPDPDPDARMNWDQQFDQTEPVCVLIGAVAIDAEITVAALRSQGVRAFAAGTGLDQWSEAGNVGQMTRVPGPLNEFRIMVHPDDLNRAHRAIDLAQAESLEPDPPELTGEEAVWRVDRAKRKRVLRGIAVFMLAPTLLVLAYEAYVGLRYLFGLLD